MDEKTFQIIGIIAARKGAYYTLVRNEFLRQLKKQKKAISDDEDQEMRARLRRAIAQLPNELFLGVQETSNIDRSLGLDQIRLDTKRIAKEIITGLI